VSTLLRHRRIVAVALVSVAAALTFALAALASGSYKDATGDGKGAPDVQNVSVSGDAGSGQLVFTINVDNFAQGASNATLLFLDTDMKGGTGDTQALGADYAFYVDLAGRSYDFAHWNGTDWADTPSSTVRVSAGSRSLTISVNKSELGNTSGVNFWVRSATGDPSAGQFDDAPDDGVWNYTLAANGPDIQSAVIQPTPLLPKAGQLFTVSALGLKVTGETDGTPSTLPKPDSFTCTATLAGKPLQATGTSGCSWQIPKTLVRPKGKPKAKAKVKEVGMVLTVTVNVTYEGVTKSFPYTFQVS
jgi:hypothetical protein